MRLFHRYNPKPEPAHGPIVKKTVTKTTELRSRLEYEEGEFVNLCLFDYDGGIWFTFGHRADLVGFYVNSTIPLRALADGINAMADAWDEAREARDGR